MASYAIAVKWDATDEAIHLGRNQMRRIHAKWLADALAGTRDPQGREWTQTSLAKASKVSRETIWKILNEKTDAEDGTLAALASALGQEPPRIGVAPNTTQYANIPDAPTAPRIREERAPVAIGTVRATRPGTPLEDEVMSLTTRALGHAVRFAVGPEDSNNPTMCLKLAIELEGFADRLDEKLGMEGAAKDLYKAALALRRAAGGKP